MFTSTRVRIFALLALLFVLSSPMAATLTAHDLFIVPDQFRAMPGSPLAIGFHSGDGFPESSSMPARLRDALLHGADGTIPITNLRNEGDTPVPADAKAPEKPPMKRSVGSVTVSKPGHYVATIVSSANTITNTPTQLSEYLKEEGLDDLLAELTKTGEASRDSRETYTKYAKSILLVGTPNDVYKKVVGLPIEIVPEKDPYAVKAGELLPVRVLVNGKPGAGMDIRIARKGASIEVAGKTDKDGRLNVRIPTAGPYRLHALHMARTTDKSKADWESLWATLTFEVR